MRESRKILPATFMLNMQITRTKVRKKIEISNFALHFFKKIFFHLLPSPVFWSPACPLSDFSFLFTKNTPISASARSLLGLWEAFENSLRRVLEAGKNMFCVPNTMFCLFRKRCVSSQFEIRFFDKNRSNWAQELKKSAKHLWCLQKKPYICREKLYL